MLDIQYIYNVNKTTLPMSKEVLINCINNTPVFGYIHCTYSELISKINEINSATQISVTKNPQEIFAATNNVEAVPEVVFKIEGQKVNNDAYANTVLMNNDNDTWTDFSTYSKEFRADILNIKELCFKKYLWNYENIHNWFLSGDIQLDTATEYALSKDWEMFKNDVANTIDLDSYISSCNETDKKNFVKTLITNAKKIIMKYRVEFMTHVEETDKNEIKIDLLNPIINKIIITSSKYNQCKKEFPMLNVMSISQRNFNMIGILT